MTIQRLESSNTFLQWVATTQRVIPYVNSITDQEDPGITLYSNTNIAIDNDVHVNGNVVITGTFILDEIEYDDLSVAGNLSVAGTIESTSNLSSFENLVVSGNIATINTTSSLAVGGSVELYGTANAVTLNTSNLTISGDFEFTNTNMTVANIDVLGEELTSNASANNLSVANFGTDSVVANATSVDNLTIQQNVASANITTELAVGTDATIYGNLNVSGNTTLTNVTVNYGNFEVMNVTNFIGPANTQIYNTILNSTAYTSVAANVAEFTGFVIALG